VSFIFLLCAGVLPVLAKIGLCTAIEQVRPIERYSLKARLPGVVMNVLLTVLTAALIVPTGLLLDAVGIRPLVTIPLWSLLAPLGTAGLAIQGLVLLALIDFLSYWRHRAEHRWFWPIHALHHAPTELHAANDVGHPVQIFLSVLFITIPLSLVEVDGPATPVAMTFVVALMSYAIHSPIGVHFGPLRKLFVDNRFHRIHHSLEERHFDRNFGIWLSVWDRMFGTAYEPAAEEWPDVGVAGLTMPQSIGEYLAYPLQVARAEGEPDLRPERPEAARG
jgi:sterol desaturase/sphingolipid hydroxylase (fatty acid hydroxylase superfamily)